MKVTKKEWKQKINNLLERRERGTTGTSTEAIIVRDYASHLSKVFVGDSVLDVGCGSMALKELLKGKEYYGLDAFPVNDEVIEGSIEDKKSAELFSVDTICAFAVMDGVMDFDKAIENIKHIAQKNVVFLTGVNIPVNEYHTFELTLDDYDSRFTDWEKGYRKELVPNVWLLEYKK